MDIAFVGLIVVLAAATLWLVYGLERLRRSK
jgi:hypothetical protein